MKITGLVFAGSLALGACSNPAAVDATAQNTSEPEAAAVEEVMLEADTPTIAAAFRKELDLQGVHFIVEAGSGDSMNTLSITPSGLAAVNDVISREIEGVVSDVEVADINADGSPEIYIWVRSADGNQTPIAYSANNRKSLSEIYFPPIGDDPINSKGYMGHSQFAVIEGVIGHRFPVYGEGGADAQPTGKTRQLQYKLTQGEAGWVMKLDDVSEY